MTPAQDAAETIAAQAVVIRRYRDLYGPLEDCERTERTAPYESNGHEAQAAGWATAVPEPKKWPGWALLLLTTGLSCAILISAFYAGRVWGGWL